MNSFDRLYTARHQEYIEISMQYHELSAQHSKRDAEFRRLLDKYERLRLAGEASEQVPLPTNVSDHAISADQSVIFQQLQTLIS